jgi:hypothetical protein
MGDEFDGIDLSGGSAGNYDLSNFDGIDFSSLGIGSLGLDDLSSLGGGNLDLSSLQDLLKGVGDMDLTGGAKSTDLNNLMAELEGVNANSGPLPYGPGGMDSETLKQLGLGDLTKGDYEDGKYVYNPNGTLQAPLDEKSGTNLDSMKDYKYDSKTGTWITPDSKTYTPAIIPSGTAKSGAQVMVDAGALPNGYNGLTANKNSTAGGNADKYNFNTTPDGKTLLDKTTAIKNVAANPAAAKSGMDPSMMALLMMLLSQMGKGGGSSNAVIPQLSGSRTQLPYSSQARPGAGGRNYFSPMQYAEGGITSLGGYSDGGQLLKGPGDGVSDSIPATIGGHQPARLADGEFVVPARIVSELGNGSTEAGARKLYAMMKRIEKTRKGANNIAANTKADRHLPV